MTRFWLYYHYECLLHPDDKKLAYAELIIPELAFEMPYRVFNAKHRMKN